MKASVGLRFSRIQPWGQLYRAMSCPSPPLSVVNSLQRKEKMASEAFLAELEAARPEIHLGLSTSLELLARCELALCKPDPALRICASWRARRAWLLIMQLAVLCALICVSDHKRIPPPFLDVHGTHCWIHVCVFCYIGIPAYIGWATRRRNCA